MYMYVYMYVIRGVISTALQHLCFAHRGLDKYSLDVGSSLSEIISRSVGPIIL